MGQGSVLRLRGGLFWGWGECFGAGECFEAPTPALRSRILKPVECRYRTGGMVYPASATTQLMSAQKVVPVVELEIRDDAVDVSTEELPRLPWDRARLIAAQQIDHSLDIVREKVIADLGNVGNETEPAPMVQWLYYRLMGW